VSSRSVDVAVVGGGVVGLSTAWRLTQRGFSVTVIDPTPGAAASAAAAGMLAPVSEVTYGEAALLRLATESLSRYPSYVAELEAATGHVVGLRREGTVIAATDAGDREMLVDLHAFQLSLGLDATMLTSRECRSLEPTLSPDIRCGLLVSSDHSVNNRRLVGALLAALEISGVAVSRDRVASLTTADGVATGVTLASGKTISAPTVVLAAGPWSGELAGLPVEAQPPVRPVKGQILRLQAHSPVPLPHHTIRGLVNGHDIYLVPRADGELVVGATVEEIGFDTVVRAGAVREMLRDARTIAPVVDELELVEATAALRPGSPDNTPIIGSTSVSGLIVATGHFRNGILLAPITADLVAALVARNESDGDRELLDVVSPQRFQPAGAKK
jgi:glycine oxidase